MSVTDLRIHVGGRVGDVGAVLMEPERASHLLVLAHGAGAGMRHAFMEAVVERLAARAIATLRYQFPYTESGRRRPDPPGVLRATVRAAVHEGAKRAGAETLLAGGKSMGGRMTSLAASEQPLEGVAGLVFFGFPLHAAGRPGIERAEHLREVGLPMLFLQGDRDKLAELERLEPVLCELGSRATLHRVEDGDHSFHVRKRSGRSDEEVLDELATRVRAWADDL